VKLTDTHQYLLSSPCHPYHTKRSIPYSLGLRLRRICSDDTAFNKRCDELAEHLKKRGYKEKLIQREINKAKQVPRDQVLKPSIPKTKCNQGIPFVVTYNPASPNLNKIISKHFSTLQSSNRCKEVFSEKPFIAYRRPRNLRDFLAKAKVKNTQTQTSPPRIKKCNSKKCKTCSFIQDGLSSRTFKNTGQVHHIKLLRRWKGIFWKTTFNSVKRETCTTWLRNSNLAKARQNVSLTSVTHVNWHKTQRHDNLVTQ